MLKYSADIHAPLGIPNYCQCNNASIECQECCYQLHFIVHLLIIGCCFLDLWPQICGDDEVTDL